MIMKAFKINWMSVLAGIMLAGMFACSENELEQINNQKGNKEESFASRNSLITETVVLTEPTDSLELILKERMGNEVGSLQKLVVSGPFTAADMQFIKNSLKNLEELDMKDAVIKASDERYNNYYSNIAFTDSVICRYMFYNTDCLKQVILPSSVTSMEEHAFYDCDGLISLEIPSSVVFIPTYAFDDCDCLSNVKLNQGLKSIGDYAFYSCDALTEITLPEGLTRIGNSALSYCSLTSIEVPSSVTNIGNSAFHSCDALTEITLPEGLTSIGNSAFSYCSLTQIEVPSSVTELGNGIFYECNALTSASIKANITELPYNTFYNCDSLATVELSESIVTIGSSAFWSCDRLSDPSIFANVTTFKDNCFAGCGFTSFDLTGKSVGERTFLRCWLLQSIVLPEGMTALPYGIFEECTSLKNVTLPSTLVNIGSYAFYKSALTSIEIPASVTSIGQYAFERTRLKELTIPATVTSVGGGFVSYCSDLRALYWNSSVEVPYSYDVENCFLYFPSGDYSYNRSYWTNVIFDGVAESIVLNESGDRPTQSYGCLKAFTAKKVTYYRNFEQTTYPGKSSGWQTIVLPFKPTSITHESKGAVAPFNSNVEGAKPFWLRALTSEGWKDVTTIEPNKGYIIAMPNHSDYMEGYRLNGKICFSAENVQIGVTPETLDATVGPEYEFQPIYHTEAKAAGVYALNVDYTESGVEYYGSAFIRSSSDVRPYEAYVKTLGGNRSARSVFSVDTRSSASRASWQRNTTGIPQIGDM